MELCFEPTQLGKYVIDLKQQQRILEAQHARIAQEECHAHAIIDGYHQAGQISRAGAEFAHRNCTRFHRRRIEDLHKAEAKVKDALDRLGELHTNPGEPDEEEPTLSLIAADRRAEPVAAARDC